MVTCMFGRSFVVAFVLSILDACSSPVSSGAAEGVSISVDVPVVHYDAVRRAVDAMIPITIWNTGTASVFFHHPCGTTLERAVNGEWRRVWFALCTLGEPAPPIEIAPRAQVTVDLRVQAVLGYGIADQWKEPVSGEYRVNTLLTRDREDLPDAVRVSSPFMLRPE